MQTFHLFFSSLHSYLILFPFNHSVFFRRSVPFDAVYVARLVCTRLLAIIVIIAQFFYFSFSSPSSGALRSRYCFRLTLTNVLPASTTTRPIRNMTYMNV